MSVLGSLLRELATNLEKVSDTPLLDIQVVAAELLGVKRTWILAHPEIDLSSSQEDQIRGMACRLQDGEPLPYVLGHWEFFGLDFHLTPQVLIPRPETELLVETALASLQGMESSFEMPSVADIGTGSGCIAVSLAANVAGLKVIAGDISLRALQVAKHNIFLHSLADRVFCVQADLLPNISLPLQMVCANLPYIPEQTLLNLPVARWEPRQALWGGQDGLLWIRRLLQSLAERKNSLAPHALVLLEVEATTGKLAQELAYQIFPGSEIQLIKDLAGYDRLLRIEIPS